MKKKEKNRLQELQRRVEETRNNPRFIELQEKEEAYRLGKGELSDEEAYELAFLYDKATDALVNLRIEYEKKIYRRLKIAVMLNMIAVGICVLGIILNALR